MVLLAWIPFSSSPRCPPWDREDNKRFGSVAFWAILASSFGYGSFVINKTAPARRRVLRCSSWLCWPLISLGRGSTETTTEAERVSKEIRQQTLSCLPSSSRSVAAISAVAGMRNVSFDGSPPIETGMATIIGLERRPLLPFVTAMIMFTCVHQWWPKQVRPIARLGYRMGSYLAAVPGDPCTLFNNAGVCDAVGVSLVDPSFRKSLRVCVYALGWPCSPHYG